MSGIKKVVVAGVVALVTLLSVTSITGGGAGSIQADKWCCL